MDNSYILPQNVISPQDQWNLNCVVYDGGEGEIAVAFGRWNENGNEDEVIALRWNGIPPKDKGNPTSSGYPTWFILPNDFGFAVIKELVVKRAAGNTSVRQDCLTQVLRWMNISQEL